MYIVGLTGGIGSGKTAVSDRFATKGICIVDADFCSRIVVEPDRPAFQAIKNHFGDAVISAQGDLDRVALRQIIFSNPAEKKWLETLLHPLIAEETFSQLLNAKSAYVILVSPLLIESQQHMICDRVLVVDVPEQLQINRTTERDNNNAEQVQRIMQSQATRETRLAHAHDVIENIHGLDHLDSEVEKLHSHYLELAHDKAAKE
jgi:dephospho-CoA kinase